MSTVNTRITLGGIQDHDESLEIIRAEKLKDAKIVLDELKEFLTNGFPGEGQILVNWYEGNGEGQIVVKTKNINSKLVKKKIEDFLFRDE